MIFSLQKVIEFTEFELNIKSLIYIMFIFV